MSQKNSNSYMALSKAKINLIYSTHKHILYYLCFVFLLCKSKNSFVIYLAFLNYLN